MAYMVHGRWRAYAYGLVTTALVLVFALAERETEMYVSDRSRLAGRAIEITIALLATLAFRPLHRRIESLIEAAFTKRRREAREALFHLQKELTSYPNVSNVLRPLVAAVDRHMSTAGSAVYLRRGTFVAEASSFDVPLESVDINDALVVRLRSASAPVDPRVLRSAAYGELAFPMMAGGELIGFLTLIPNRIEYEAEDRHALGALADAAGVALLALDSQLRVREQPRTNLPHVLTSFVGRENELAEIRALLQQHRLVTLVGAGGVGKTRTALQIGSELLEKFADGVWLVELAPLSSGDFVPSTVAQVMGLTLASKSDPLENLVHALKLKHALLIFDNCEHLVDSAAGVIAAILRACPRISVVASSRQPLGIAGEYAYRLPSLEEASAIALFVERAVAVDQRFALSGDDAPHVTEICRRLDGIPLAIELAASRTSALSLKHISEKLNERFRLLSQTGGNRLPRQQTLRALIDWSFDLLSEDERAVFRRLSVFAGGWTLPAAAAICTGEGIDEWQVFDLLSALVAKSLVVAEPRGGDLRYSMLNSIRDYSDERLTAENEAEDVKAKHARYYAELVCDLAPLVASLEDVKWQHTLAPEIDNIRAALDWAIFQGHDVDAGLRLLSEIEWPELVTTPAEAVRWFDAAATFLDVPRDAVTKARILRQHVRLKWLVGRPIAELMKTATDAIAAARASRDADEIARALASLGASYRDAERFDDAEPLFQEAYRSPENLSPIAANEVLRNWAVTNLQHGDVDMARRRFTEVADKERPGSESHASALLNLGELEFEVGNVEAARTAARKARETLARLRAAPLTLVSCNLAAYAMAIDDFDEARYFLRETLLLLRQSGSRWMITALEHHAVLAGLLGDHERASVLLGFTDAHSANAPRQRTEQRGYERLITLLSQIYDPAELARRMSTGARLTDEQALEYAAAISQQTEPSPAVTAAD